jgi:hypothetical protein
MPVLPVARYPMSMRMRRSLIRTWNPDILIPIPTMVAIMPGPFRVLVWRRRNVLMNRWRGTNANHNLCLRYACGKYQPTDR